MNKYSELEYKFEGKFIDKLLFLERMATLLPSKYEFCKCPDVYYIQGDNVVRHRLDDDAGEVTVKNRKSDTSITDRLEVNLKFANNIKKEDVTAFLLASGWKRDLVLNKDAHVFWFDEPDAKVCVALYDISTNASQRRRFLEIEVDSSSELSHEEALNLLNSWKETLFLEFEVGELINDSLWEIYSGKRYKVC